ncbi:MAG: DUF4190 domain-containing protein [Phycisphaeraceae bacterium]
MSQYPTSPHSGGQFPNDQSNQGAPGIAIAALVCGIIGFCFAPLGIVALILGIVFLSQSRDGQPGRGMALAGTILGGFGLVVGVVALLIAILLPALGAARSTAQRMQNSTQLRGIHQGMVTYANSNKNHFPGLATNGEILVDGVPTGNSGDGNTPQARAWILLDGDYMTPEYLISPSETEAIYDYAGSGPVTKDNYSYAMLSFDKTGGINTNANTGEQTYAIDPATFGRSQEWGQTINSQTIVLSDRNTGTDANFGVDSIHSDSPGNWRGSVLWNDNHVEFASTHIFQTKYANGSLNNNDNLFEDDGTGGFDALLIWDRP